MKISVAVAALCLLATACAGDVGSSRSATSVSPAASSDVPEPTQSALGSFQDDMVEGLVTDPDIAYTDVTDCGGTPCVVPGDVLAPAEGTDLPTIVLLPGGGQQFADRRLHQGQLAVELAERGAVVFLMSYRSAVTGNYDSDASNDARCAVRYARVTTEEYGGDPDRVIVVGHSQGGFLGLDLAIHPEEEAEPCLADGSGKPDAVVGLGAPLPSFSGAGDSGPPIWLFAGSDDIVVQDVEGTAQRLRDRGFDARATELPGVTHDEITDPIATPEIVDLIFEAVDSI